MHNYYRMGVEKLEDEKRSTGQGMVVPIVKTDLSYTNTSKQLEDFNYQDIVRPPIEPRTLMDIVEQSDRLPSLIDAIATNLALFGWGIKYKDNFDYNKSEKTTQERADQEWTYLEEIFTYFNLTESFEMILYRAIIDKYTVGYGVVEILRDATGSICGGEYARAVNFRIATSSLNEQYAQIKYIRKVNGEEKELVAPKRFKKFVQLVGGERRYFKEFGDPRHLDYKSGIYSETPLKNEATEVIFITSHNPASSYGNTPWIGCIPEILGNRKASEVNLDFFNNGKMIPFAILTNGGLLTQNSIDALKDGKGLDNFFKCLILEAKPPQSTIATGEDIQRPIDVKIQPLTDTSLKDALFQEYQKQSREKVRGAFRLPPIYLGDSGDYTRATADTARFIAEEQIFVPIRRDIASGFNMVLEYEANLKYCELYFKGPQMGGIEELSNALAPYIQAGAVSPNMLIDTLGKLLGKDFEPLPDEIGNIPIELLKLMKNGSQEESELTIQKSNETLSNLLDSLSKFVGDTSCL